MAAAAAVVVIAAVVLWMGPRRAVPPGSGAGRPGPAAVATGLSAAVWAPGPATYEGAPVPEGLVRRLLTPAPEVPPSVTATGGVARLGPATVLATVNGVGITLADLMPVDRRQLAERPLAVDMVEFLLDRAIARELTFQSARERGVTLAPEQVEQLEKIRVRALERDPASFSDAHDDFEAKAEFEVRDFAGLMLQDRLLADSGGPPKYVTPELVRRYFEEHAAEFAELPAEPVEREQAWQNIEAEIRVRLAAEVEAGHQRALDRMLGDLKSQARIDRRLRPAP